MGKYKIRVKVELVECDGAKEHGVIKEDDAHPTIRDAISKHLSEVSKKKRLKKANQEK